MSVAVIGLTGGMGAGKSTALEALRRLGAETISTDEVVHDLYREPQVIDAVVARLGRRVAPDGEVDRAAVADAVFADPAKREWLERLLWPLVGERIADWLHRVRSMSPPPKAAVLEVPLLFESGFDKGCDATIAVVADEATIALRTAGRELVGARQRSGRQLSQTEKASQASFVVHNDGDLGQLEQELAKVLENLGR
jgi:dephospho-CoA kinase